MIAFYGIFIVYIGQEARSCSEGIIQNLQQIDSSIKSFSYITKPSSENWRILVERRNNIDLILENETWKESPVEILKSIAIFIVNNCTEASKMDEKVREWLESLNITRFPAHYNLAVFSLDRLVYMIYREFPSPPAQRIGYYLQSFVRTDFPACKTVFLKWGERYTQYYSGILEIFLMIRTSVQNISESYSDAAKLASQTLEELRRENRTEWEWHIKTTQELIQYYNAMSTYYESIFESLSTIYSLVLDTTAKIHRYDEVLKSGFSQVTPPLIQMALFGVVIPMIFLSLGEYIDNFKIKGHSLRILRLICTIVFIILFVNALCRGIKVIWQIIYLLYFS